MPGARAFSAPDASSSLSAWLGGAAADALLAEAALPHKPGLVCPGRRGAHDDMDYALMVASAEALRPWLGIIARAALASGDDDPRLVFASLRPAGVRAEEAMFRVTGGVNTHKGAIFALGLLAAAAALVLGRHPAAAHIVASLPKGQLLADAIRAMAAGMAGGLVSGELDSRGRAPVAADGKGPAVAESAGERLYREHGARGARGQAEAGYPIVGSQVLPALRRAASTPNGTTCGEAALVEALLGSMAELEDTCILSRGGQAGLDFVWAGARTVLEQGALSTEGGRAALMAFDAELTKCRLSPGGSADLLSAGIFLDAVEARFGGADHPAV